MLDVAPVSNTVTVGPAEELDVTELTGVGVRWCGPAPAGPLTCRAQVRAHGETVPVRAEPVGAELRVSLVEPLRGVAPGQAVVLYDGTRVVGSATIARTSGAAPSS